MRGQFLNMNVRRSETF